MTLARLRLRLCGRRVLVVLMATALFLLARALVRERVLERLCTDAGRVYEDGRCQPAAPPVILHRDLLRT
jgi:hypothetical protein